MASVCLHPWLASLFFLCRKKKTWDKYSSKLELRLRAHNFRETFKYPSTRAQNLSAQFRKWSRYSEFVTLFYGLRICNFVFHNGHHWKNLHHHLFCCCGRHSSRWSRWQWGTRAWRCLQWLPFASPASSLEAPQPCKKCSWSKAQWEHCSKVHNQRPLQMLMEEGELFLASLLHWWKYNRSLKVACNILTATKTSKGKKTKTKDKIVSVFWFIFVGLQE